MSRTGIALLCAALLSACASAPPMRFYTLTAVGAGSAGATHTTGSASATGGQAAAGDQAGVGRQAGASGQAGATDLRVQRLIIPGEIDRPEIVRGLSGDQLQIADQDRWGAPLEEMIRRVLNENLGRPSDSDDAADARTTRAVTLEIEQLLPAADCSVNVRAIWMITTPPAAPKTDGSAPPGAATAPNALPLHGTIVLRTAAPSASCAAADVPAALSAALGQLAERLRSAAAG